MKLDIYDIEKGIKQDNRWTQRLTEKGRKKNADLRLINGGHEGVQRDDNKPI